MRVRAQYLTNILHGFADVNDAFKKGKIGKEMIAGEDAVAAVEDVVAAVAAGNMQAQVESAQIGTGKDAVATIAMQIQPSPNVSHSTHYRSHRDGVLVKGPGWVQEKENVYISKKGHRHDTTKLPPGRCFICNQLHWRKDCPASS